MLWPKRIVCALALFLGISSFGDVEPILKRYQTLTSNLAADKYKETSLLAGQLPRILEIWLEDENLQGQPLAWAKKMQSGAEAMGKTTTPEKLREYYGEVSEGALHLTKGSPLETNWQLYYCPMVKNYWAQPKTEKMANPYMGLKMLLCGSKKAWAVLP